MEAPPLSATGAYGPPAPADGAAGPSPAEAGGAAAGWESVRERLLAEPWAFDFFQAMQLLERLETERASVGGFAEPARETVRIRANPDAGFPASEVQAIDPPGTGAVWRASRRARQSTAIAAVRDDAADAPERPLEMTVNFMGLTGPQGVLPLVYTQHVAARVRAGDTALEEFLDLFNHRIVSLFYRAWQRSHLAAAYEAEHARGRAGTGRARDHLTPRLHDLAGLGTPAVEASLPVPAQTLAFYAGLLSMQTRPAAALEQLLRDYFRVPVVVEQFVGGWYALEPESQTSVGASLDEAGQLGLGAVAGDEVWDPQAAARLRIGPLPRARYEEFLPTGSAYPALLAIARYFANDQLDFEVQLVLERDEVPACVLGADPAEGATPLGWCTWLKTKEMTRDPDDTVFSM